MARSGNTGEPGALATPSEELAVQLARFGPVGKLFSVHFKSVELRLSRTIAPAWARHELRTGTTAALAMIAGNPGASQKDVAQAMQLDKSGMTAIVNQLERLGWAERRRDGGDKRRNALFVTAEGAATLDRIMAEMRAIEARMLSGLSGEERQQLTDLLDRLHDSIAKAEARD